MQIGFHEYLREKEHVIPETADGFDPALETDIPGMMPVSYVTDKIPAGTYRIHIGIRAVRTMECLYLFTGRKQLRDIISLSENETYENTYLQNIAEIIPRWHSHIRMEERLYFTYCAKSPGDVILEYCYAEPTENVPLIYLCGDSTVTDQSAEIPYNPGGCYASWGQALTAFIHKNAAVQNQAHCGLTSESFRREGHFDIVRHHLKAGDLCLFQFGHNDQKLAHLQADREYPDNLRRFAEEVWRFQASPVFVTPLGRNIWIRPGEYNDLLMRHAEAMKKTAEALGIPVIDLHKASVDFIKKNGQKRSCDYFHPDDYTHTNEYGAYLAASYIAERLAVLFPEKISVERRKQFIPPPDLWERIRQKNNRPASDSQREVFDRMEKNVSDLLQTIAQAERQSKDEKIEGQFVQNSINKFV